MILQNFDNCFKLANVFLGVGMACGCARAFSRKEGGIQV
jgi:hypothetical protein